MNQNETRTLWISVAAAIFAVFLVYSYTQEKRAELTKKFGQKKGVVVATVDIPEMQTIDDSMITIIEQPASYIQPDAVLSPEEAVGLVALAPIKKGEQLLQNKIVEPGVTTGLSLQVSPGKRALTIPVDEMRGVAKLLKPGDRIDLIAAIDVGTGNKSKRIIRTLMQNVTILATGLKVTSQLPRIYEKSGREDYIKNLRDDTSFSNITIEATPREAQNLIYVLSTSPSSLFLTLRHPSDYENQSNLPSANVDTLLGMARTMAVRSRIRTPSAVSRPKTPLTKRTKPPKKQRSPRKKKGNSPFVDL